MKTFSLILLIVLLLCFTYGCQEGEKAAGEQTFDDVKKYEIAETIRGLAKKAFDAGTKDLAEMFSYYSDDAVAIEIGQIDYSWEEHKKKKPLWRLWRITATPGRMLRWMCSLRMLLLYHDRSIRQCL
jgi:hypothetical protein